MGASDGLPIRMTCAVQQGGLRGRIESKGTVMKMKTRFRPAWLASMFLMLTLWAPVGGAAAVAAPTGPGYWLEAGDGGVFAFGSAPFLGSATQQCTFQCWGIGATADAHGYWIVDNYPVTDPTQIRLYGFGSAVDLQMPNPDGGPLAVASTPSSKGGWILLSDGTVVPFGDAQWFGDGAGLGLFGVSWPPFGSFLHYFVGIASTPDGKGYWLAGVDGGVFAYGDASFYGSMGARNLNTPVTGIARTTDGHGYWLVSLDGGVFSFGDAVFEGCMAGRPLNDLMVGIAANPDGSGYWTVAQDGGVFAFGDAPFLGSMANRFLHRPIYGIAASS